MRNIVKQALLLVVAPVIIIGCLGGGGGGGSDEDNPRITNSTVTGCFVNDYPDSATSEYILPYQVGMTFLEIVEDSRINQYVLQGPLQAIQMRHAVISAMHMISLCE